MLSHIFKGDREFVIFREVDEIDSVLDTRKLLLSTPTGRRVLLIERMKKSSHFNSGHYELVVEINGYSSVNEFVDEIAFDDANEDKYVSNGTCVKYNAEM